ncbi:beta-propeller domain-containing protein [Myxococcota bacterium]
MRTSTFVWPILAALTATGCIDGMAWLEASWGVGPTPPDGDSTGRGGGPPAQVVYESDHPEGTVSSLGAAGNSARMATGSAEDLLQAADGGASLAKPSAERIIEEADIIKLEGNRLYAMSRTGGLSVVDVGTRDQLQLLGRWRAEAEPFELYVRDGVVIGLYNGWGQYVEDTEGNWVWATTSEVVVLNTEDPQNIVPLGSFSLPGDISDSRVVGDVLYAVSHRDGYCWRCGEVPETTVISLNLSDPQDIRRVDELNFEEAEAAYSWNKSVTVTPERMYVAGPVYGGDKERPQSSIQVVDISDPSGNLELGANVELAGQIDSRWQMDEQDEVLRVISQPSDWDASSVPVIQTFSIGSSDELTPLASVPMVLPRPERLQSVRFDGERAYAITFERVDPLFTIDLSNPAEPRQAGELEMPGWVYFMVPRGERLLGLGYEQDNPEGSLTVSLFDVSNVEQPTMLDRVNFGGNWGSLAEDQDRIHKAFNVLDELGLVLVPYGGWRSTNQDSNYWECGSWENGVQLIDWEGDELTLRGMAPQQGQARRAFYHDERLFTVSEERVETFDISDRDEPEPTADLPLALRVDRTLPVGDNLVRFRLDYRTDAMTLEVVPASEPDTMVPLGSLDLASALFPEMAERGVCAQYYSWGSLPAFAHENHVYVVIDQSRYARYLAISDDESAVQEALTRVVVIDVSDPSAPTVVGTQSIPQPQGYSWYYNDGQYYPDTFLGLPDNTVQNGSTVVLQRMAYESTSTYSTLTGESTEKRTEMVVLDVFDLADPGNIVHRRVDLPPASGFTGVQFDGNVLLGSHWNPSPTHPDKVRFYVHRVDLSDPSAPSLMPEVNVPGSLVEYDSATGHALTVDYERQTEQVGTPREYYYLSPATDVLSRSTAGTSGFVAGGGAGMAGTPSAVASAGSPGAVAPPLATGGSAAGGASGVGGDVVPALGGAAGASSDPATEETPKTTVETAEDPEPQPYQICYGKHPTASYDWSTGVCTWFERTLNLIAIENNWANVLDSEPFPEAGRLQQMASGDDRLFLVSRLDDRTPVLATSQRGGYTVPTPTGRVGVISGLRTGKIAATSVDIQSESRWGDLGQLYVEPHGQRAMVGERELTLIDASNAQAPELNAFGELPYWVNDVRWLEDRIVVSLGEYGVEVLEIP